MSGVNQLLKRLKTETTKDAKDSKVMHPMVGDAAVALGVGQVGEVTHTVAGFACVVSDPQAICPGYQRL